jgi:disulfide bond formation protein DsbB
MSYRTSRLLLFFVCHEMLMAAYYFQFVDGLEPCPLCIFQRLAVIGMGLVFLLAGLHNPGPGGQQIYDSLALVPTLFGVTVAARHVWLQHLPADQVPSCGPGLNYMLETLPISDTIARVFRGSGDCAEVSWRLWGLSMPEWTLLFFLAATEMLGLAIWRRRRSRAPWL